MDKLVVLFILSLTIILVISVGVKLYQAKKNDGVITKQELEDIVLSFRTGIASILLKYTALNKKEDNEKREFIESELKNKISNNSSLTDLEKQVMLENIDTVIDIIIDKESDLLEEASVKAEEKRN